MTATPSVIIYLVIDCKWLEKSQSVRSLKNDYVNMHKNQLHPGIHRNNFFVSKRPRAAADELQLMLIRWNFDSNIYVSKFNEGQLQKMRHLTNVKTFILFTFIVFVRMFPGASMAIHSKQGGKLSLRWNLRHQRTFAF